jgi:hypothetical protein
MAGIVVAAGLSDADVDAWFAGASTPAMAEEHERVRQAAQVVEEAVEAMVDGALAGEDKAEGAAGRLARAHALHRAFAQQLRRLVSDGFAQRSAIERVSASHAGVCEVLSHVAVFEHEHGRPIYATDEDGELEGDPDEDDDDDVAVARQAVLAVVGELEAQVFAELRAARWIANRAIRIACLDDQADA